MGQFGSWPPKRYYVGVFSILPIVFILFLIPYAVAGMAIGAISGWLVSLATKCGPQGIRRDALLGSFGFPAGFIGCIYVLEHLKGGGSVVTTMNGYQHPERVAIVMAILLPLLHELYRLKRARTELKTFRKTDS